MIIIIISLSGSSYITALKIKKIDSLIIIVIIMITTNFYASQVKATRGYKDMVQLAPSTDRFLSVS